MLGYIILTFDKKPMLQLSFFLSVVRCEFQCRSSCSIISKYLTWNEGLIFLTTDAKIEIFSSDFIFGFKYQKFSFASI